MANKRKKSAFDNLMDELTPEKIHEMRQKRYQKIKETPLEFFLGYYVGEEIIRESLVTLDVDMIKVGKVIKVSDEDYIRFIEIEEKLEDDLRRHSNYNSETWEEHMKFHKEMEKKYLPETITHYTMPMVINDVLNFKRGISAALVNSDACHYSINIDDIHFQLDVPVTFLNITLKRAN